MSHDEALDLLDRCYHSPAVNVVRAEVERLRATITEMEAGYGRAARMIVGLKADLAAANELINRYSQERAPEALVTVAKDRDRHFQRAERAEADLAAARARVAELAAERDQARNSAQFGSTLVVALRQDLAAAQRDRDEAVQRMKDGWIEVTQTGIVHFKERAERAEADLAAARAALRELIGMIEIAAVMPDAINKHMRVDWDDPVLQRARAAIAGEGKHG